MSKYHVNNDGEPGLCRATIGDCPFGGEAQHYPDKQTAQKAFELSMASSTFVEKTRSSNIAQALDYNNLYENAKISIDFKKGGDYSSKEKAFKKFADEHVPEDSKVMLRLTDGTIIFDKAGNGYLRDAKITRMTALMSGKPSFAHGGGASLKGLNSSVSVGYISSISVIDDFPKYPEKLEKGEILRDDKNGYAIFTPDSKKMMVIVNNEPKDEVNKLQTQIMYG